MFISGLDQAKIYVEIETGSTFEVHLILICLSLSAIYDLNLALGIMYKPGDVSLRTNENCGNYCAPFLIDNVDLTPKG